MKFIKQLVLFVSLLISNKVSGESYDSLIGQNGPELETAIQKAGCQQYLAHGYRYEHMYPIDYVSFDNTDIKTNENDITHFKMHIAIKSLKDGIILLSPKPNPGGYDLVFEIGVGIAVNKFTILRITKDSSNEVARVATPDILSDRHYTYFYIDVTDDVFTFGKEGSDSPLITYTDIRLRSIKYFDISSWGTNRAKFLYDCPAIGLIH